MRPVLSGLDRVGKKMNLERQWQKMSAAYNYLFLVYQSRESLTPSEANDANHICQMLKALQSRKTKEDKELSNEMIKYLFKMIVKQIL